MERCLINIENHQDIYQNTEEIESTIQSAMSRAFEGFRKDNRLEVYVLFTGNEEMRVFNREQRDIDAATDVLSFPLLDLCDGEGEIFNEDINPETGCLMMGDVIISLEKANEQSLEYGHSFLREIAFLATHGAFHLMGYDHDVPEREKLMLDMQENVLSDMGLKR